MIANTHTGRFINPSIHSSAGFFISHNVINFSLKTLYTIVIVKNSNTRFVLLLASTNYCVLHL
jgi:hypothetical protein